MTMSLGFDTREQWRGVGTTVETVNVQFTTEITL